MNAPDTDDLEAAMDVLLSAMPLATDEEIVRQLTQKFPELCQRHHRLLIEIALALMIDERTNGTERKRQP